MFFNFFSVFILFLAATPLLAGRRRRALIFVVAVGLAAAGGASLGRAGEGIDPTFYKKIFIVFLLLSVIFTAIGFIASERIATGIKFIIVLVACGLADFQFSNPPTGKAAYWLVDSVNKTIYHFIANYAAGYTDLASAADPIIAPLLIYISAHYGALSILFLFLNLLLGWWAAARFWSKTPKPPPLNSWRLPAPLLIVALLVWSANFAITEKTPLFFALRLLGDALWAGYLFRGLVLAGRVLNRREIPGALLGACPVALMIEPRLLSLVAAAAITEALLFGGRTGQKTFDKYLSPTVLPSRVGRVALLIGAIVGALLLAKAAAFNREVYLRSAPPLSGKYLETKIVRAVTKPDEVLYYPDAVTWFAIDRYEFPNRAGELPIVGIDHDEAGRLCAEQGKRLCRAKEWELACAGSDHLQYLSGYDPTTLSEVCNYSVRGAGRLEGAGDNAECKNNEGVYDMVGNAWEWLADEPAGGYEIVAGGSYYTWDDYACGCTGFFLLRRSQQKMIDNRAYGFRCCRDLIRKK